MTSSNTDSIVHTNMRIWMDAMDIKPVNATPLNYEQFMNKMLTQQYVSIDAVNKHGKPVIIVVVSKTNDFMTKKSVNEVTKHLPMDGSAQIVIASANVWSAFAEIPFIKNVPHSFLLCDIRKHCNQPIKYRIVDDIEQAKWDTFCMDESSLKTLPRIKATDPMVFWIGAKKGDYVEIVYAAEDAVEYSEMRIVV